MLPAPIGAMISKRPAIRVPETSGTMMGLREAAHVQECLRDGLSESPLVPAAQTLELLGVMDDVRRQLGVQYAVDPT